MMPYVKLYKDMNVTISLLSDEEAGRLLKAIMHYTNGTEDDLPGQEKLIFAILKAQIERDEASYQQFCDKQRENGMKGGRPRNPKEPTETQQNPTVFEETHGNPEKPNNNNNININNNINNNNNNNVTKKAASRFTPPTVSEVNEYCRERNNNISADGFVDFYTAKGWRIGNQPMKDWRAAVRTWEKRDNSRGRQQGQKTVRAAQYDQRSYTEEQLASITNDPIVSALEARYGA